MDARTRLALELLTDGLRQLAAPVLGDVVQNRNAEIARERCDQVVKLLEGGKLR